jgi:hypothetical protein
MNERIKKLWLDALRSDKYKQARDRLRDGDGFCCLGVLCDIVKNDVGGRWEGPEDNAQFIVGYEHATGALPAAVQELAGLKQANPEIEAIMIKDENAPVSLAGMNDHGVSFAEIADIIEEHL